MTHPGKQELAPAELAELLGGELPSRLPIDGWRTVTVHCQVDAIGPSDRHPDLVKLELSFPPAAAPESCPRCRGRKVVPPARYIGQETPEPCPECSACTATALHALLGRVRCALSAGHYDEAKRPTPGEGEPFSSDPGGWHQSAPNREGLRICWADTADGAVPHGAAVGPAAEPSGWVVPLSCPTCGPTSAEPHPRFTGVVRCVNCKEHLRPVRVGGEAP
ncbi:hypothetical protein [Streptomyces phaeoluteigriseus]